MTYINPHGKPLRHIDRLVAWQRGEKPAPVTLEWDLSNRCVYGCAGCHFAYTHSKGPLTLTSRALPMLHDAGGDLADTGLVRVVLEQAKDAGVQSIVWTGGGEPTTHPHWLGIMAHAAGLGLEQGLYTLGALITEQQAVAARDMLSWVVVSLDAPDAESYASEKRTVPENFGKACQAIRNLSGGSATVGVSFLLHAGNWMRTLEMLQLFRSLSADYVTFRPLVQTSPAQPGTLLDDRSWVTEAEPILRWLSVLPGVELDVDRFRQWRDWSGHGYTVCQGVKLNATITPDGRVWYCPNRREFGGSCLGDLRTESFTSIWARHHGHYVVDSGCRAMCRLHPVNQALAQLEQPMAHEAFI